MKALVKTSKASGVTLMDVDIPTIGPRDVLIKVKATAICGSDIDIYHSSPNKMRTVTPPVTIGHETCGEVVEIGDCVSNIKKSDMVSVEPHFFCGTCYYCQTGTPRNCENLALFGTHVDAPFC